MQDLTNHSGFGLAVAVWLAHDEYSNGAEEFPGENVISVTALLKPTRQTILEHRRPPEERIGDVADLVAPTLGHAIHDSIEKAWLTGYKRALQRLGYPQKMIDKIKINPETVEDGDIPVYLEQRDYRRIQINNHSVIVSGKFDQIIDGEVNDTKSTSVYTYTSGSKEEDYRFQGSAYRWLNPKKVTKDVMNIQFVFTDWSRAMLKSNPKYPPSRLHEHKIELMPLEETERRIKAKIMEIIHYQHEPEEKLPRCTDKELWKSETEYKYYSDPAKAKAGGRATRNFKNDYHAALRHRDEKGKGVVVTIPGEVKACLYCGAYDLCSQRKEYFPDD